MRKIRVIGHGSDVAVIPTLASATFTRSFSHSLSRSCFYLANERKEDYTRYALKGETHMKSREIGDRDREKEIEAEVDQREIREDRD